MPPAVVILDAIYAFPSPLLFFFTAPPCLFDGREWIIGNNEDRDD